MESEKVKKIKEKLQEEIFIANSFGDKLRKVPTKELENLLTLINELESENEKWQEQNGALSCDLDYINEKLTNAEIEVDDYKDRIAELEKENKDYYDRLNNLQTYIDNHEEIWKGNTNNALKQFAERLKEKLEECSPFVGYDLEDLELDGETIQGCIDETLKEFINE